MLNKKLLTLAVSTILLSSASVVSVAQAGLSADVGVTSAYVFRGIQDSTPAVYGGISFSHESGVHANVWTSSTGVSGGNETDLTIGWGTKMGEIEFDVSFIDYLYPSSTSLTGSDDLGDNVIQEIAISASMGPISIAVNKAIANPGSTSSSKTVSGVTTITTGLPENKYTYFAISGSMDKIGVTLGMYDDDISSTADYKHLDVNFSATDNLTFSVTKTFDAGTTSTGLSGTGSSSQNPIVRVSYDLAFDL